MKNLEERIRFYTPEIISWRRHLHQYPELAMQEFHSAGFVKQILQEYAPPVTIRDMGATGVMGVLRGEKPGRTVVLRADLDALPLQEETGLSFASKRPGIMHACGHDGNTAILLGAAAVLSEQPVCGEIRFLFEPSEEKPPGGAVRMVAAGALEGADCIFGVHVDAWTRPGYFRVRAGASMAACMQFTIEIRGKGGHAANAHECADTVYTAASLIVSLQSIVSRRLDARNPAVLSVTSVETGAPSYNILPGQTTLRGTVRTLEETAEAQIREELDSLVKHICESNHTTGRIVWESGYPVVWNDPDMASLAKRALAQQAPGAVLDDLPVMGSEDFAVYLKEVPGCFIKVGTQKLHDGDWYPHHHSKFDVDETGLIAGVEGMARIALMAAER